MFNKKGAVKGVKEIISNNDMNSLIGRKLQKVHFNAAMTIEQNVDGETREMIYMFGASVSFLLFKTKCCMNQFAILDID